MYSPPANIGQTFHTLFQDFWFWRALGFGVVRFSYVSQQFTDLPVKPWPSYQTHSTATGFISRTSGGGLWVGHFLIKHLWAHFLLLSGSWKINAFLDIFTQFFGLIALPSCEMIKHVCRFHKCHLADFLCSESSKKKPASGSFPQCLLWLASRHVSSSILHKEQS